MDPISDMLTRIRNASMRGQKTTLVPYSNLKKEIATLLAKYRFIRKFESSELSPGKKVMKLYLKYENGQPAITGLKRISKSGQRIYSNSEHIQRVGGRRGMIIVSTSKGLLPHWEAKKQKAGGEVLCVVY
jgi:small subunit ribosomal protein S8